MWSSTKRLNTLYRATSATSQKYNCEFVSGDLTTGEVIKKCRIATAADELGDNVQVCLNDTKGKPVLCYNIKQLDTLLEFLSIDKEQLEHGVLSSMVKLQELIGTEFVKKLENSNNEKEALAALKRTIKIKKEEFKGLREALGEAQTGGTDELRLKQEIASLKAEVTNMEQELVNRGKEFERIKAEELENLKKKFEKLMVEQQNEHDETVRRMEDVFNKWVKALGVKAPPWVPPESDAPGGEDVITMM